MKPLFGSAACPKGGFGNRLLSYMNVRVLSARTGARYFFDCASDKPFVTGMHKPLKIGKPFRRFEKIRAAETMSEGFFVRLLELIEAGMSVDVKGAMLGETLARHLEFPIRDLVRTVGSSCEAHRLEQGERKLVTAHFRAGDFYQWNPSAVLPAAYYFDALNFLAGELDDGALLRLVFDDHTHPALDTVRDFAKAKRWTLSERVCKNRFLCDFAALSESDFLVSSPSTFAITAALVGAPKVIHSKEWVSNRVARGELFWAKVSSDTLVGHTTLAVV